MEEKVILQGEIIEGGIFKKTTKPIQLTKTKLVIGEKVYPIEDIVEAFNDYSGFSGVSKLRIRLKNGEELSLTIKHSDNWAAFNLVAFEDFSTAITSLKNIVDKWVNTINTLKLLEQ